MVNAIEPTIPAVPPPDRPRRRILLVTYPFPPVGGAGVQRVTKFVKYLPRCGWDVSVLTVDNPSVPLYDASLGKDVPPDTVVRRARSWEPGYGVKAAVAGPAGGGSQGGGVRRAVAAAARRVGALVLQPDPQVLWMPAAVAEGRRLLRRLRHDAVLASGPPFSTFLIGAALARGARLPLVLDYRDEWTLSNEYWENKRLDPVSRAVQGRMQRRVVRAASGLVATTRSSAEALSELRRAAGGTARVTWVYNGFDPDDFAAAPAPRPDPGLFRLAYVGTLWNLTSPEPLVAAVTRLAERTPELAARLEVVFVGRRTGPRAEAVNDLARLPCRLVAHPYLEHTAAVGLMRGSDALCLLLTDLPGAGRVVPAKLFEYVAAGRPVLTIAPPGEARALLAGHPGARFAPAEIAGIADWLAAAVTEQGAGGPAQVADGYPVGFTRTFQARQLAAFLDGLVF